MKVAQSSESQNDYRPFISFVFPLGPVRVYCVGNRPWEADSGEQAYSGWPLLWVVSRDWEGSAVLGSLMGMSNQIWKLFHSGSGLDIDQWEWNYTRCRQAPPVPSLAHSVKLLSCGGELRVLGEGWRQPRQWMGKGLGEWCFYQPVCSISLF